MKSFARFSVQNPVTIWMFVLGVMLLGTISLTKLGTDLFPNLNSPRLFIQLKAGEQSPEEIEVQFIQKLESVAIRQSGVSSVTSETTVSSGVVTVSYQFGQDMDEAFLDLQKSIGAFSQNSSIDELTISRFDPNSVPIIEAIIIADGNVPLNDVRKLAETQVANQLVQLDGIADVKLFGGLLPEVVINTDPQILSAHGLSNADIITALNNFNRTVSGGYIEEDGQRYIIKGTSIFQNVNQLNSLVVGYRTPASQKGDETRLPILLNEVATVSLGTSQLEDILLYDNKPCIGVYIYKETGFNTVNAVSAVAQKLEEINLSMAGYQLKIIKNQGGVITEAIDEVKSSALMGIVLAIIILFVFLRRVGVTMVVAVAMPISIIATFNLMYFNGLTLNVMTLGGLALGAGMLVDNAIVAVENIFYHQQLGKSLKDSIIDGIGGIGGAIFASTITTVVVFLPVVYLQGATGELFKDQALTVSFSLLSSLFIAIFFVPVLANLFFSKKPPVDSSKMSKKWLAWYENVLIGFLNKRNSVLIISLIVVIGSFFLVPLIKTEFMPSVQSKELELSVKMPAGTMLTRTAEVSKSIANVTNQLVEDKKCHSFIHAGPNSTINSSTGEITGNHQAKIKMFFENDEQVDLSPIITGLQQTFNNGPSLSINFSSGSNSLTEILDSNEPPFEIHVQGSDLPSLIASTKMVKQALSDIPNLAVSYTSFEEGAPEVLVKIDRYKAGLYNYNVSSIMDQVSQFLQGTDGGNMEIDGELVGIRVQMPSVSLQQLKDLIITNGKVSIKLSELADVSIATAPTTLSRVNQKRVGKIQGYILDDESYDDLMKDVNSRIEKIELPTGNHVVVAGQYLKKQASFKSLIFALILSVILVYMVMAAQFESLLHPFTILLSMPLALVGVIWLFLAMGQSFNVMALIGVVMLGGIAVNNAILLVDAINQNRWQGIPLREAIVKAANQRIRPILMTSLTTILALVPAVVGFGDSVALRSPMAMAVIGGMITSTLLNLVVIPCVYDLFDRFSSSNSTQNSQQL